VRRDLLHPIAARPTLAPPGLIPAALGVDGGQ